MRVFYFNITYRCNSCCMFCAADHPLQHEEKEMSLAEFDEILKANKVGKDDRVIVNGGEPTIHRDFFGFLDLIGNRGATIDLFSNGIRFAKKEFADRVLSHKKLYIRIPLFGGTADVHDTLTGCPGGFDSVTKGLDYICGHLEEENGLEIKMLLSKITISENEKIYKLAQERWNQSQVGLSLNPLLISNCVIHSKDMFIDTYERMLENSAALIQKIHTDKRKFSMALIPFCAFPNDELMKLCHGNKILEESFYADPSNKIVVDEMKGREPCFKCKFAKRCSGYPESYVRYFGKTVMKPFI